jgi:hypothetical protein
MNACISTFGFEQEVDQMKRMEMRMARFAQAAGPAAVPGFGRGLGNKRTLKAVAAESAIQVLPAFALCSC